MASATRVELSGLDPEIVRTRLELGMIQRLRSCLGAGWRESAPDYAHTSAALEVDAWLGAITSEARVQRVTDEARRVLGVEREVEVHPTSERLAAAHRAGGGPLVISLHWRALAGLDDDALLAVIGHELGHHLAHNGARPDGCSRARSGRTGTRTPRSRCAPSRRRLFSQSDVYPRRLTGFAAARPRGRSSTSTCSSRAWSGPRKTPWCPSTSRRGWTAWASRRSTRGATPSAARYRRARDQARGRAARRPPTRPAPDRGGRRGRGRRHRRSGAGRSGSPLRRAGAAHGRPRRVRRTSRAGSTSRVTPPSEARRAIAGDSSALRSGVRPGRFLRPPRLGRCVPPCQRVPRGLREGAEAQPLGDGAGGGDLAEPRVVGAGRDGQREVPPPTGGVRVEPGLVDPGELRGAAHRAVHLVEHRAEGRVRGADRVVDPHGLRLDGAHQPVVEVAHVDELHPVVARAGRDHLAAARHALRPVDDAVRRVARSRDHPGPHDQRPPGHRRLRRLLGERLERPVGRLVDLLDVLRRDPGRERQDRRALVDRILAEAIDRDGGDEDVVPDVVVQHLCGVAHQRGTLRPGVDDGVPVAPLQEVELGDSIAEDRLHVGEDALGAVLPRLKSVTTCPWARAACARGPGRRTRFRRGRGCVWRKAEAGGGGSASGPPRCGAAGGGGAAAAPRAWRRSLQARRGMAGRVALVEEIEGGHLSLPHAVVARFVRVHPAAFRRAITGGGKRFALGSQKGAAFGSPR